MTSSWIILFMTLVDSYLNDIEALKLSTDDLKYIIGSCNKADSASLRKKEHFVRNMYALREIWEMIADLHIKIATEKSPGTPQKQDEMNIVANKLEEFDEQLEKELNKGFEVDEVFDKNECHLRKSVSEESVTKILLKESTNPFIENQRSNPFDKQIPPVITETNISQQVLPEIEMQRKISMQKDMECKKSSLSQLMTASMELLKLLPNESTDNIRLLVTNKINESFLIVEQVQSMDKSEK